MESILKIKETCLEIKEADFLIKELRSFIEELKQNRETIVNDFRFNAEQVNRYDADVIEINSNVLNEANETNETNETEVYDFNESILIKIMNAQDIFIVSFQVFKNKTHILPVT